MRQFAPRWPRGSLSHEYAALRIKQAVVGFGRADKRQVQAMVQRLYHSIVRRPVMRRMRWRVLFVMRTRQVC